MRGWPIREWIAALIVLTGCEGESLLVVDLRTDLSPGRELGEIVVDVDGVSEPPVAADVDADYLRGVRVAEVRRPAGDVRVTVRAFDPSGAAAGSRQILVSLRGPTSATAVISRQCSGVSCPGAGDPADATACFAGRCVSPRCRPEEPAACGAPECTAAADCPSGVACARPQCLDGECLLGLDDGRCAPGQSCDRDDGCTPPLALDAGPPDAGAPDAGPPDAGPPPRVRFGIPARLDVLSTMGLDENDPTMNPGGLELIFVSRLPGNQADVFVSRRATPASPWQMPNRVGALSSGGDEAGPALSADGLTIHLGSIRAGGMGRHDVWSATRADLGAGWSAPTLEVSLSTPEDDSAPSLDASDLRAVVALGEGAGRDLVEMVRASTSSPWVVERMLDELNTGVEDGTPMLTADSRTLYFASDRPGGMGARDLYVATRAAPGDPFDPPELLEELNTAADESDPWLSPDGREIYFDSTRAGDSDLFVAVR